MRIAIDARELAGKPTGVGRYLTELLRAWRALAASADHEFILCAPDGFVAPSDVPTRTSVVTAPGQGTRWEQIALRQLVRAARADVLFAPAYSGPLWSPVPMVLTIHDVSFAAHPEWFSWREGTRRRLLARLAAAQAARVLTLSEFSRREIVERLGVPPERVEAIPLGVPRRAGTHAASHDRGERILYVGTLFNRRHIPSLVEGFSRFAATRPRAQLDIVGDNRTRPWVDMDALVARSPARTQIRVRAYVSEPELNSLYAQASAFVFLSEYEGFGLTPLEALAADVPIVVLDTPVAREVYGRAAVYLERPDPAQLALALEQLVGSASRRADVLDEARATLARYSWTACAERTLDVLLDSGASRTRDLGKDTATSGAKPEPSDAEPREMTRLTVVIVSYNCQADLDRCLAALHDTAPRTSHQIVVVDNASQDGTAEWLRHHWPQVLLVEAGANVGFSRANNLGIRRTASELVLLLNPDTVAGPGQIDRLVGAIDARPDAGAVGPRLVDAEGRAELSFGRMMSPLAEARQKLLSRGHARRLPLITGFVERLTRRSQAVDWVSGACLLVRRADLEIVGLLDERFFMYTEDVDLCASLRAAGRTIWFEADVEIVHARGRSASTAPAATRAAYRGSRLAFYRKHHPRWAPLVSLYLKLRG